jgi:hypothetical protein
VRTLDQIYWNSLCNEACGCDSLTQALIRHPQLKQLRDGKETVTTSWFQVEFHSHMEGRFVPLFAREATADEAKHKAQEWLPNAHSRVVKVTQTIEVVEEYYK